MPENVVYISAKNHEFLAIESSFDFKQAKGLIMKREIFNDMSELNKRIKSIPKGTPYRAHSSEEGFVLVIQDRYGPNYILKKINDWGKDNKRTISTIKKIAPKLILPAVALATLIYIGKD